MYKAKVNSRSAGPWPACGPVCDSDGPTPARAAAPCPGRLFQASKLETVSSRRGESRPTRNHTAAASATRRAAPNLKFGIMICRAGPDSDRDRLGTSRDSAGPGTTWMPLNLMTRMIPGCPGAYDLSESVSRSVAVLPNLKHGWANVNRKRPSRGPARPAPLSESL